MKLYHIYDKVGSVMIKTKYIFDDFSDISNAWLGNDMVDSGTLALVADTVIQQKMSHISVPVDLVANLWPWVEGKNIKILTRFNFVPDSEKSLDIIISDLARDIMSGFRRGASGAQIYVPLSDLQSFVSEIKPIRDDLFFDKEFSLVINIDEINSGDDWNAIFEHVRIVNPDSVLITSGKEKFDASSDFVGRIYAMLEHWDLNAKLFFLFGKNMMQLQQAIRLTHKMQPNLSPEIYVAL